MNSIPVTDIPPAGAAESHAACRAPLRLRAGRGREPDARATPYARWFAFALALLLPGSLVVLPLLWLLRRLADILEERRRWQAARPTPDSH